MSRKKRTEEYENDCGQEPPYFDDPFSETAAAQNHAAQMQKKQLKKKKSRKVWTTVIILLLLALMVGEFAVLLNRWVSPPDLTAGPDDPSAIGTETGRPIEGRKPGCYTILIAGKDKVANLTDTIMVGMLDTENHSMRFVSIPRDTAVNVKWSPKKVNMYYAVAENGKKDGIEALIGGVEQIVGYRVDSYAIFDVDVFVKLVDTMGGVEFDVPVEMNYDDPVQDLHIHVHKGPQKLNGYDTMGVFRFRNTYPDGDIGRLNVQHDLLTAVVSQLLKLGNIPHIKELVDIYEQDVTTNLSAGNVMFYVQEFLKMDRENITFETIPANYNGVKNGMSYVFIKKDEWVEYINTYLNPYTDPITADNIDIIYETGNGGVAATTGKIQNENRW